MPVSFITYSTNREYQILKVLCPKLEVLCPKLYISQYISNKMITIIFHEYVTLKVKIIPCKNAFQ